MTYRPSGRSNRSGRSQAENDVFEGLPVKQWDRSFARVSLVPPVIETAKVVDDRWGELPLPKDCSLLAPFTQHLLRLARSGQYGSKRRRDQENADPANAEGEDADMGSKLDSENRGYLVKKWRHVPEAQLEPEHQHFEFLAKRRKGLPSLYGNDAYDLASVPTRKTKVKRTNAEGVVFIYDVLVGESQTIEGELPSTMTAEELAALPASVTLGAGTVIEGLGVANDDGIVVVDQLRPLTAPRRNKSSAKKKGGPGRGKKRVTFTNPDGSTYTTVVPNATKIIPQPGQTVKHVAKGEVAMADITKEEAARMAAERGETATQATDGEDAEEGDDDDEDDDNDDEEDDDDDREDGEVTDDEATTETNTIEPAPVTAPPASSAAQTSDSIKAELNALSTTSDSHPAEVATHANVDVQMDDVNTEAAQPAIVNETIDPAPAEDEIKDETMADIADDTAHEHVDLADGSRALDGVTEPASTPQAATLQQTPVVDAESVDDPADTLADPLIAPSAVSDAMTDVPPTAIPDVSLPMNAESKDVPESVLPATEQGDLAPPSGVDEVIEPETEPQAEVTTVLPETAAVVDESALAATTDTEPPTVPSTEAPVPSVEAKQEPVQTDE